MKAPSTLIITALVAQTVAAGPLEAVYEGCKFSCFPLLASVGGCIKELPSSYSLTYTPSENTATWTGDIPKLVNCFCSEEAQSVSAGCVECVNGFGCSERLEYAKVCTDPQYIVQYLQSVHSGIQCSAKARRAHWPRSD